jgi:hypothetical protein
MRPKTIAWIVVAGAVGVTLNLAFGVAVFKEMTRLQRGTVAFAPVPCPPAVIADAPVEVNVVDQFPGGQPCLPEDVRALRGPMVSAREYTVSGPFTHGNLAVYLIHGRETLRDQKILTLQAALERNLATVHEGQLAIDNRANVPLFLQAGDIIKGGHQDRVLPYDQLIPPQTQGVPLAVFCVEAGRSGPRGLELSTSFQSATEQLPGKQLHLAARHRHSQADVWNGVRATQLALARNAGGSVQAAQSQTSLQLTLETARVQQAIQSYLGDLAMVPAGKKDVVGVAVAVNGQIQGAEVYASAGLLQDLWPKLLKANAVAALAERRSGPTAAPSREAVQKFLSDAEDGQPFQQELPNRTRVIRHETAHALLFDTCDPAGDNLVVHRSFLAK